MFQGMLNCLGRFLNWLGWGSQCGVSYNQGYTELYLCDTSDRGHYYVPLPSPVVVLVYDTDRKLIAVRIDGRLDGVPDPARVEPPYLSR